MVFMVTRNIPDGRSRYRHFCLHRIERIKIQIVWKKNKNIFIDIQPVLSARENRMNF